MIALFAALVIQTNPTTLQCYVSSFTETQTGTEMRTGLMTFEISGDAVRVQTPPDMFASIRGQPEDQWRSLADVRLTERELRGFQMLSPISRMDITIDRMTGSIATDVTDSAGGNSRVLGACIVKEPTQPLF